MELRQRTASQRPAVREKNRRSDTLKCSSTGRAPVSKSEKRTPHRYSSVNMMHGKPAGNCGFFVWTTSPYHPIYHGQSHLSRSYCRLTFPRKSGSSAICVDLVRSDVISEGGGPRCKMEDERSLFFSWVPHCGGDASRCGGPAHHSRETELRRSLPKLWPAEFGRAQPLYPPACRSAHA